MARTTPDLSHLTADEKQIIQAVIHRQQLEDDDEFDLRHDHDYSSPSIFLTSSNHPSHGVCQICQKSPFVHEQCSMCHRRFCLRCGIRSSNMRKHLCHPCRNKQEQYFSSSQKNFSKQYLSDYILTQTTPTDDHLMMRYGANEKRILPKSKLLNMTNDEENCSSKLMMNSSSSSLKKRLLPEIRKDLLRDFQYHSLEERDLGQESTLKDSGIDTASSSTILNVISSDKFHQVSIRCCLLMYLCVQ